MQTGVQPLVRGRRVTLSLETFRLLAVFAAAMLVLVVATGATVRLTGSGLGCEHWPGCEPHHFEPRSFHSYVEFGNRVIAFVTILATLGAWIGALLAATPRRMRWLAFGTFFGTLLQAPLGAITIHYHLNPYLVLSHFLLSIVVLTLAVVLAYDVVLLLRGRRGLSLPPFVRAGSLAVAVALLVLVVSGTFATASGPHPGSNGSQIVQRLWSFDSAIYWHVRATAVFGISFALLVAWLARHRRPELRGALLLLGILAVQMAVGEIQYRTGLRWWLVLVHVAVAATTWAVGVLFVYSLWRPTAARRLH